MTLSDSLVHPVLIVGTVSREGGEGIGKLVEKRVSRRAVVDFFPGQLDRNDFGTIGIDAEVQFTPGSAPGGAMLFDQPFAGPPSLSMNDGARHGV